MIQENKNTMKHHISCLCRECCKKIPDFYKESKLKETKKVFPSKLKQ